ARGAHSMSSVRARWGCWGRCRARRACWACSRVAAGRRLEHGPAIPPLQGRSARVEDASRVGCHGERPHPGSPSTTRPSPFRGGKSARAARHSPMSLLKVEHVTQRFGGLVANHDISIKVERGELVGLIGPNGAGKSTLFNLIAGVMRPSEGKIWFDGEDVTDWPATVRCARGLARTFQVVKSFDTMSVIDNVIVGALVRTTS